MKRHPALIPLSRDHHNGLVQALRLRHAAADGDASARLAAAREFVEFFRNEERVNLRDEEEELFPLLLRHVLSQPAPLREARVQHVQLQGFARKLEIAVAAGIVDRATPAAAGELLDAHIRVEERLLFPLISARARRRAPEARARRQGRDLRRSAPVSRGGGPPLRELQPLTTRGREPGGRVARLLGWLRRAARGSARSGAEREFGAGR